MLFPKSLLEKFFISNSIVTMGMLIVSIDFGTHLGTGAGGDKTLMLFIENNKTKKERKYDRTNAHIQREATSKVE